MSAEDTDRKTLPGLRRGIAALRLLATRPEGGSFTDLQNGLDGLPAPTLSRLIKALEDEELVLRTGDNRYRLGPAALSLARALLGSVSRRERLQPIVDDLAAATLHSAACFERQREQIVMLAKRERPESFHYIPIGTGNPQSRHGFLQPILAFLPDDERGRMMEAIIERDGRPPFAVADWHDLLLRIRQEGYHIETGLSRSGASRITAPIFLGPGGEVVASIGVSVPENHSAEQNELYRREVLLAARRASELLAQEREVKA